MFLLRQLQLRLALNVSEAASVAFGSIWLILVHGHLVLDPSAKSTLIVIISDRALSLARGAEPLIRLVPIGAEANGGFEIAA